jgi:hypothetical protein
MVIGSTATRLAKTVDVSTTLRKTATRPRLNANFRSDERQRFFEPLVISGEAV